jgi:hypothetical protein
MAFFTDMVFKRLAPDSIESCNFMAMRQTFKRVGLNSFLCDFEQLDYPMVWQGVISMPWTFWTFSDFFQEAVNSFSSSSKHIIRNTCCRTSAISGEDIKLRNYNTPRCSLDLFKILRTATDRSTFRQKKAFGDLKISPANFGRHIAFLPGLLQREHSGVSVAWRNAPGSGWDSFLLNLLL